MTPSQTIYAPPHDLQFTINPDAQRAHCAHMITRCRSALAPHRNLPNELLAEIFCVSVDPTSPLPIQPNWNLISRDPPWNISHVCSRWRRVLFSTAEIWSSLILFNGSKSWQLCSIQIANDLFRHYSASRPLSLEAALNHHSLRQTPFSDLIVTYVSRWKHLNIGPFVPLNPSLFASTSGPFTSLESLTLSPDSTSFLTLSVFSRAPNLRHVTLRLPPETSKEILHLPLANLATLHVYSPSLDHTTIFSVLKRCTSLTSCVLTPQKNSDSSSPSESTKLPFLQHLHLSTHDDSVAILSFLSTLDLTALLSFRLLNMYTEGSTSSWEGCWPSQFTPTLVRSRTLERLTLGAIGSLDLLSLLQQTPSLVQLELVSHLPPLVRERVASGELVPKLTDLSCGIYGLPCLERHVGMLRRRRVRADLPGSSPTADIRVVVFRALGARWSRLPVADAVMRFFSLNDEGWCVRLAQ